MWRKRVENVEIVALTLEQRMRLDANRNVEIARLALIAAGVALPRHTDPRVVCQSRRDLDRQRLALHLHLLPAACGTRRLALAS